jgi:hypothetical protein
MGKRRKGCLDTILMSMASLLEKGVKLPALFAYNALFLEYITKAPNLPQQN